jgi:protein TonB
MSLVALDAPGAGGLDRRMAVALAASFVAHLMLVASWGDGGPRPAPMTGGALTARLVGPERSTEEDRSAEPAIDDALRVTAEAAPPKAAPSSPTAGDGTVPGESGPRAGLAAAERPGLPGAASPGPTEPTAPPQPPLPVASPGPGLAPGWFAARDLDVLPRPLSPVEFAYPAAARAAGLSGKVELQLSIDASGQLVDIDVLRADPRGVFEAAALAAFRAVRYSPGLKDGRAVRSRIRTVAVFDASALAGNELPR